MMPTEPKSTITGSGHDCMCDTLLYCYPYQDNYTVPVLSSHAIISGITIPIPLFFFIISFVSLPYGRIEIAKGEINIYE